MRAAPSRTQLTRSACTSFGIGRSLHGPFAPSDSTEPYYKRPLREADEKRTAGPQSWKEVVLQLAQHGRCDLCTVALQCACGSGDIADGIRYWPPEHLGAAELEGGL